MRNAQLNAGFQNDALNRDADAPTRAAQAAALRASAWQTLNPQISPDQALNANVALRGQDIEQRGQDVQLQAQMAQRAYMAQLAKGQPQTLIVPGDDGSISRTIEVSNTPSGPVYRDESTGQTAGNLGDLKATGAIPSNLYNSQEQRNAAIDKQSAKDVSGLMAAGSNADNQIDSLKTTLAAASQPGAMTGPGIINRFGRAFDQHGGVAPSELLPPGRHVPRGSQPGRRDHVAWPPASVRPRQVLLGAAAALPVGDHPCTGRLGAVGERNGRRMEQG